MHYRILFVCTGNICRSPTAEGVLRHHLESLFMENRISVDSAGTHGFHVGEAPDVRSIATAQKRGIAIKDLRARQLEPEDFQEFDLVLGLDRTHTQHINDMLPKQAKSQVHLFLEYAGGTEELEVPDPYYGSQRDFDNVIDLIETGVQALMVKLQTRV